ncbi:MAG: electron transfer flavoprotein subunit alpha/FixB family protein [Candidatus Poseidoniia archaeon]|jgi:electron transfer flavoprotein alpha subunit|nr:electron transfer flavoprotein subunit alpha/FixB family protein [Candidatus Poseidoniia archaeon]MDP7256192.1 electron transfer flavoprotein subunit alpha/FixB family protein [Candidatus Poseidoniia archaeon]|tara:strand:- start:107 stop:1042 length:936 start_codon:yes stop_codon:yes gene_type:complete
MKGVMVVCEHLSGEFTDITFEMLGLATSLDSGEVSGVTFGAMGGKSGELGAASNVILAGGGDDFNPETYAAAVKVAVEAHSPGLLLVGSTSMGMDLASPVAAALDLPLVAYCTGIEASGGGFACTSSLYGGKMGVSSQVNSPAVVMVLPGAFDTDAGRVAGSPTVSELTVQESGGKVRFSKLIEPDAGDVDITQSGVLVAVGRGIGSKDDIELAEELAELLEADLACSRPIVDAGWMEKSRQIGKSGFKVKPRVYIALGISGAPEHIEGMKESATIIAINCDENAPIFDIAHYGLAEDLFDVCEELIEELE